MVCIRIRIGSSPRFYARQMDISTLETGVPKGNQARNHLLAGARCEKPHLLYRARTRHTGFHLHPHSDARYLSRTPVLCFRFYRRDEFRLAIVGTAASQMKLDKNQKEAVQHLKGPAVVVAGPGSGKTTVITERILNLIRVHNVPPSQILAIAFNRKAVAEMAYRILPELASHKSRALSLLMRKNKPTAPAFAKRKADLPQIRTLHALGKDIIVENYRHAGFQQQPQPSAGQLERIIADERKHLEREISTTKVAIYKIESQTTGRCYIGQSIYPERRKQEHFSKSSNDRLRQAIRNEGTSRFSFELLEWVDGRNANRREAHWIRVYKERCTLFNRAAPLPERFSNQVMLEMFCQHFGIPYEKHFDRHPDFENFLERFDKLPSHIRRAKRQVKTGSFEPKTIDNRVVQVFAERYEARKTEVNAIDFEDMLINSANLFETHPDIRQTYRDRYRYVLVDEFQDVAPADFRLISQLSDNLFAVGDDDQAIYGFRGGDSQIMLEFAARRDVLKYEITRNYRSTSTLVEHARALIERNAPRIKKNLRAHNPGQCRINSGTTTQETLEEFLHQELRGTKETVILARTNYEVEQIRALLFSDTEVEVTTIHKAKGREWNTVILIHNTLGRRFPHHYSDIREERQVFYVAMTRAKLKLVILGGNCAFISEFKNVRKNLGYCWRQFRYWHARRKLRKEEKAK